MSLQDTGPIRLIVGLGNPGEKYAATRHNAGFWLLDALAAHLGSNFTHAGRFQGVLAECILEKHKLHLAKPLTFMNRSGVSVGAIARYFQYSAAEILIVHDELDLAPGMAKLKYGGSAGGHNGLKSITSALGPDYWRCRIGIGHPRDSGGATNVVDFVLQPPDSAEKIQISKALENSMRILPLLCAGEYHTAQMRLHTRPSS